MLKSGVSDFFREPYHIVIECILSTSARTLSSYLLRSLLTHGELSMLTVNVTLLINVFREVDSESVTL